VNSQTGTTIAGWTGLGGGMTGNPSAVSAGGTDLHVFVRGTFGPLFTRQKIGSGNWSDWQYLGGFIFGSPTALARGTGRMDVFFRHGWNGVGRISMTGGVWGEATSLGGEIR
jgi:hypothetical protein